MRGDAGDLIHAAAFDGIPATDLLGPLITPIGAFAEGYIGYQPDDLSAAVGAGLAAAVAPGLVGRGRSFQPLVLERGTGSLTTAIASELDVRTGAAAARTAAFLERARPALATKGSR